MSWLLTGLVVACLSAYGSAAECTTSDKLENGTGTIQFHAKVKCGKNALFGSYIQVIDNFQAVNDVIAHGHTDLDGNFEAVGYYFEYADVDLHRPVGNWLLVIYSYCGVPLEIQNQCHRVTKYSITCGDKDRAVMETGEITNPMCESNGCLKPVDVRAQLKYDIDIRDRVVEIVEHAKTPNYQDDIFKCLDGLPRTIE